MQFDRAALLLAAVIAVIAVVRFVGPAVGYWDTYVTAPALHVAGQSIDFVLRDGTPQVVYELDRALPDDLVDRGTFGIITKDQRLGAGVVSSPAFTAFGLAGFRLLHGALWGLIALAGCLVGRAVLHSGSWGLAVGAMLCLNPYAWAMNRLNPNVFAVAAGMLILAVLTRERPVHDRGLGAAALVGLLFGAVGNVRPELIVVAPAIAWGLLRLGGPAEGGQRHLGRFAVAGIAAAIAITPTLLWNGYAFGDALVHSSQFGDFEGFRPTFEHRFVGAFNGLLNWPFHDAIVRTPHFPLPVFLLAPAQAVMTWGALLLALGGLGALRMGRSPNGILLALWFVPAFLLLLPHENWDELKMTYALLYQPALAIWVVAGLREAVRLLAVGDAPRLGGLVTAVLFLALGARALAGIQVPLDERWYVRFPGAAANGSGIALLTDEPRRGWELFHTRESPEELAIERARYARGNVLPARYWEHEPDWSDGVTALGRELGERELRLLAVWYYIYGGRRDDVGTLAP